MKIRSITAPNPGPLTLDGTHTWLLGEQTVLDPGPAIASHIEAIRAAVPSLRTILITHRHGDHAPAAAPLKEATGATVIAPPDVLDDATVDLRVRGGETIDVDGEPLRVVATPGHTREHVCYLTAGGDLFTGDTVLGEGTTAIFPPDGNMADYIDSLRRLRALEPVRIFPAHGPMRDDEQQVLDALAGGALTLAALREAIYPNLDPRLAGAAEIQITAHLIKLVAEGRADPESLQSSPRHS